MDQQIWLVVIGALAGGVPTLMAILIERYFAERSSLRELRLQLEKENIQPIAEYLDAISAFVETVTFLAHQNRLGEIADSDVKKMMDEFKDMRKLEAHVKSRALPLSEEIAMLYTSVSELSTQLYQLNGPRNDEDAQRILNLTVQFHTSVAKLRVALREYLVTVMKRRS